MTKPTKCDGNHGGPRCADPECWNDSPPTDVASPVLPKVAEILAKIEAGKYVSKAEIQMASMVEADRLGISVAEWEERYRPNRCAGPHCRNPKCDLCAPAVDAPPGNSDGRFSIGSPTREWARIGPDGRHLEAFCLNTVREDAPTMPMAAMVLGIYERGHTNGRLGAHSDGREVRVPLERSYDTRVKMLLAFNTARKEGFDVDEALEAAWQALLRFSSGYAQAYTAEEPERTRYETWVKGEWPTAPLKFIRDALPPNDPRYGHYVDSSLQNSWCGWQARAMHAPAPKLPEGTEQVSSAWLAQLRQEYREYGQQADDLREQNKALQATIDQLRQHKTDYMEAAEETAKAQREELAKVKAELGALRQWETMIRENSPLVTRMERAERELAECDAMAGMLEEREWAEHAGTGTVSGRVEAAITQLHNELAEQRDRPTLAYGIVGNRYMVKPTRGELPDVYEDAQVIELVRGRPYTRKEPQA